MITVPMKQAPAPRDRSEPVPTVRWRPEPPAGSNGANGSNGSAGDPAPVNGTATAAAEATTSGTSRNGTANGTDTGTSEIAAGTTKTRRRFLVFGRSR